MSMATYRLAHPACSRSSGRSSSGSASRCWPRASHGVDRHARDRRSRSSARSLTLDQPAGPRRGAAPGRLRRVGLRGDGRRRRAARDPDRPAVAVHGARRHRRLDADPPLLGRLHGRRPRLHALLRVPELLRLLDAAAGPGGELPPADRRLGVRRRGLLPADLVLVPAHDGDRGGHQGVRHQRRRRRRPRARDVLHLQAHRHARLPGDVRERARHDFTQRRRRPRRRLHPAARRRVREVRPGPAAHLAPGRHGGPDPGLRADPRGDDGHRRRLPDRAHAPAVRAARPTAADVGAIVGCADAADRRRRSASS